MDRAMGGDVTGRKCQTLRETEIESAMEWRCHRWKVSEIEGEDMNSVME